MLSLPELESQITRNYGVHAADHLKMHLRSSGSVCDLGPAYTNTPG